MVKCERRKGKGERKRGDGRLVHALPRIRGSEHKRVRDGVRSGMTLFALVTSLAIAEIATIDSRMQRRASRGPESGSRRPGFRRYEIRALWEYGKGKWKRNTHRSLGCRDDFNLDLDDKEARTNSRTVRRSVDELDLGGLTIANYLGTNLEMGGNERRDVTRARTGASSTDPRLSFLQPFRSVGGRSVGRVDGQIVETVSKRLGQFPAFPRQFTILTDVES